MSSHVQQGVPHAVMCTGGICTGVNEHFKERSSKIRALLDELKNTNDLLDGLRAGGDRAIQFLVAGLPKLAWIVEDMDGDASRFPEWDITVESYKQLERPVAISEIICVCHCVGDF